MVRIIDLHKKYGRKTVLQGLNFSIERGIVLVRGPNGSGKSTLLRILAGIERATSGRVEINGLPPQENRESISYMGHRTGLYLNMTLEENLNFFSSLYRSDDFRELVNAFGIGEYMKYPLNRLSRGSLQKVGLIRALMKDADVYLLDEPSTALDVESKRVLSRLLEKFRNRIVFIATHDEIGVDADAEINL